MTSTLTLASSLKAVNMIEGDYQPYLADDGRYIPLVIEAGTEPGDPNRTPMAGTPAYSEHPSGYNCVTAAFMHTAEAFFGKSKTEFSLVKLAPGAPTVTRTYERFTDVIDDTIDARIYQGIHFRTADVQGAGLGKDVARWLDKHYFAPTN